MRICCVWSRQPHAYKLHRKIWECKVSNNLKVLIQFYCTLLRTQLYVHVQNCWMTSTMHSCYIMVSSNVQALLVFFFGEDNRHIMFLTSPISSFGYDLTKILFPQRASMQKSQSTKYVTSELCSCGSDPFCRIACVMFHELTFVSCPEVFQLFLQLWWMFDWTCLCERLFCTHEAKKYLRDTSMNRYQFVTSNESKKNTNGKLDNNKLSTNKRRQFLENIVTIDETSEQKPNEYCNVDFVFRLGSNKCFLYLWHHGTFIIMNLYLFLIYIYIYRNICYFCIITYTVTEVANGIVNASNKELPVCVW